tara:strand:+ start:547 stop:753 length:207 start_codon:yes stop_codon:yes gene_type:complete
MTPELTPEQVAKLNPVEAVKYFNDRAKAAGRHYDGGSIFEDGEDVKLIFDGSFRREMVQGNEVEVDGE